MHPGMRQGPPATRADTDYTTDDLSSDTLSRLPKPLYQQARRHGVRARRHQGGGARRDNGGYSSGGGRHHNRAGSSSDNASSGADTTAPWLKVLKMPQEDMACVSLGDEVSRFGEFMSLTQGERASRNMLKSTLQDLAHVVWPAATVKIYGSFAYGLSLPTSDVDMVVEDCDPPLQETFPQFVQYCADNGFIVVGEIPGTFLKIKSANTGLVGNITFTPGKSPVRSSVAVIKEYLARYPNAAAVIMVVRTVLSQCNLVDVPSGGLSSFAVILMVFYVCQNRPEQVYADAGELLTEFLRVFGEEFDYDRLSVMLSPEGQGLGLVPKQHPHNPISVVDPLDPQNNVADQCRKVNRIRSMFKHCRMALSSAASSAEACRGHTPLSTFIAHKALWSRLAKFQPVGSVDSSAALP